MLTPASAVMVLVLSGALATGAVAASTADLDAVFLIVAVGLTVMVALLASRSTAFLVAAGLAVSFGLARGVVALGPLADTANPLVWLGSPYLQAGPLLLATAAGAALLFATATITFRRNRPGSIRLRGGRLVRHGPGTR